MNVVEHGRLVAVSRLIAVSAEFKLRTPIVVGVGDVLSFAATGVRIDSNQSVLEQIGPLTTAVIGLEGSVLAPEGPPSAVFLVARAAGVANVTLFTGDPWGSTVATMYAIRVADDHDASQA